MIRAVLWDLDGTLVDSEEFHWLAWREVMAREGVALTREQFLATFGHRNDAILPLWLPDISLERAAAVGDDKESRYRELVSENGLAPLPGASEWVKRLAGEGWRQAVASSAPRANIGIMLEALGLAQYFQASAGAEDVTHGKPAPDVFLEAAARLGAPASRCIAVEDAAAGIEAARRAGMKSIGVTRNGAPLTATVVTASLTALSGDTFHRLLDEPL